VAVPGRLDAGWHVDEREQPFEVAAGIKDALAVNRWPRTRFRETGCGWGWLDLRSMKESHARDSVAQASAPGEQDVLARE
jgi:hypothetical protein